MSFAKLIADVTEALERELPGSRAHARMAPQPRRQWPAGFDLSGIRQAASLLLLVPNGESASIVLTVRAEDLRHGGQVSMPGGVIEPDESVEQAAVREAHEEIGLDPHTVQVIGALTPIDIPVSGFRMHPIVASVDPLPALTPDPREVARILTVPLDDLRDHSRIVWRSAQRDGREYRFPAIPFDGAEIWGATAMALAEFLALLE